MKTFYHSGSIGDIIYSLPTVEAMGGGIFVCGMDIESFVSLYPLMEIQHCIKEFRHISEYGLPADFINLSNFRNHPLFTRIHIAELHAEVQGVTLPSYWQDGWIGWGSIDKKENDRLYKFLPRTKDNTGRLKDYAVISVTPRYRDRFYNWNREIKYLRTKVDSIIFLGHEMEYRDSIFAKKTSWMKTGDLLEAAYFISHAKYFSGNQSAMLALRQSMGMDYRFEMSPNHRDTEQGRPGETIINPITRRLHLATVCVKRALFDTKKKLIRL